MEASPFDNALHPELRLPVFDNRLQYDEVERPVGMDPDIDKEILSVDGSFADVGGFAPQVAGQWARSAGAR